MDLWNLKWLQNGIKEDENEKAESRENKKNESKDSHVAKILLQIMNSTPLVNREMIDRMPPVIQSPEVDAFDEYG